MIENTLNKSKGLPHIETASSLFGFAQSCDAGKHEDTLLVIPIRIQHLHINSQLVLVMTVKTAKRDSEKQLCHAYTPAKNQKRIN